MPKNDPAGYLPNVIRARKQAAAGYQIRAKQAPKPKKIASIGGGALAPAVGGGMKDRVLKQQRGGLQRQLDTVQREFRRQSRARVR